MDMRRVQHEAMVEEWKQIIIECRNSGQPVIRWCKENNVKENRYYYWLNVIRNEALVKGYQKNDSTNSMTVFAQVKQQAIASEAKKSPADICAVIRLEGFSVEINNGASQETIAAIMQTLKASC